jgi:outer membrane protein OmpA-like peptidoglycan-associated protein
MGYMKAKTTGPIEDQISRGSPSIGVGALFSLRGNQRNYIRAQIRDIFFRERDVPEFNNHFAITLGIHHIWGGRVHDSDVDGVRDWLDTCPNTPLGAKVTANGCPIDSDNDKVFDGIDKCAGTPAGCTVDKAGCPSDPDSDGVCVGLDQCPDTPRGATVNAAGCPADPDSDGVDDGIDQCANTPRGCTVDAKGCPGDADGDGVCDGKDLCDNTPEGWAVDANGCPTEVRPQESDLLDTGIIRVPVEFDDGKTTIKPASLPALNDAAKVLQQFPSLRIQVGGHTDNKGSDAANNKLSADRAAAVVDYLKQNFPKIPAGNLSSRGYGSSQPIAPNTTSVGRGKNRRIEFKVLNNDALKTEREKRRAARK